MTQTAAPAPIVKIAVTQHAAINGNDRTYTYWPANQDDADAKLTRIARAYKADSTTVEITRAG